MKTDYKNRSSVRTTKKSFFKELLAKLFAILLGFVIAFTLAEVVTRYVIPIFPGVKMLDMDGNTVHFNDVAPDRTFRLFSSEFDAVTTITKDGYRVPEVEGNPDLVFIGDSFTYGQGLKDDDTFIANYCKSVNLSCMNLGVPGYGTINAVERLENFLKDKDVRPRKVYLFMLAMTSFLGAGNDLYDNIKLAEAGESMQAGYGGQQSETFLRRLSNIVLSYSNLARVVKFYLAPYIKKVVVISPSDNQLELALSLTKTALNKLKGLSILYKFDVEVVLIHPVQDISRGSHTETLKTIKSISPIKVTPSASWFENSPNDYYFALDGHFNKKGSDRIVELLKTIDKR